MVSYQTIKSKPCQQVFNMIWYQTELYDRKETEVVIDFKIKLGSPKINHLSDRALWSQLHMSVRCLFMFFTGQKYVHYRVNFNQQKSLQTLDFVLGKHCALLSSNLNKVKTKLHTKLCMIKVYHGLVLKGDAMNLRLMWNNVI